MTSVTLPPFPDASVSAPSADPAGAAPDLASWDPRALCELLEPIISESIARKARQRRYTP